MKLLLLTYSGARPDQVGAALDRAGVAGYTRMAHAYGHGLTGPREGTRAWPGEVAVFYAVVADAAADPVAAAMQAEAGRLPPGERLHLAVLPVERFF